MGVVCVWSMFVVLVEPAEPEKVEDEDDDDEAL